MLRSSNRTPRSDPLRGLDLSNSLAYHQAVQSAQSAGGWAAQPGVLSPALGRSLSPADEPAELNLGEQQPGALGGSLVHTYSQRNVTGGAHLDAQGETVEEVSDGEQEEQDDEVQKLMELVESLKTELQSAGAELSAKSVALKAATSALKQTEAAAAMLDEKFEELGSNDIRARNKLKAQYEAELQREVRARSGAEAVCDELEGTFEQLQATSKAQLEELRQLRAGKPHPEQVDLLSVDHLDPQGETVHQVSDEEEEEGPRRMDAERLLDAQEGLGSVLNAPPAPPSTPPQLAVANHALSAALSRADEAEAALAALTLQGRQFTERLQAELKAATERADATLAEGNVQLQKQAVEFYKARIEELESSRRAAQEEAGRQERTANQTVHGLRAELSAVQQANAQAEALLQEREAALFVVMGENRQRAAEREQEQEEREREPDGEQASGEPAVISMQEGCYVGDSKDEAGEAAEFDNPLREAHAVTPGHVEGGTASGSKSGSSVDGSAGGGAGFEPPRGDEFSLGGERGELSATPELEFSGAVDDLFADMMAGMQVREHSAAVERCGPHVAISLAMLRSSNAELMAGMQGMAAQPDVRISRLGQDAAAFEAEQEAKILREAAEEEEEGKEEAYSLKQQREHEFGAAAHSAPQHSAELIGSGRAEVIDREG